MSVTFEWDANKATSNLAKHAVSFEEACSVFGDPLARVFNDDEHSDDENREIAIGYSEQFRLLFVSYTARGRNRFRIISARKATKRERRNHEEGIDI